MAVFNGEGGMIVNSRFWEITPNSKPANSVVSEIRASLITGNQFDKRLGNLAKTVEAVVYESFSLIKELVSMLRKGADHLISRNFEQLKNDLFLSGKSIVFSLKFITFAIPMSVIGLAFPSIYNSFRSVPGDDRDNSRRVEELNARLLEQGAIHQSEIARKDAEYAANVADLAEAREQLEMLQVELDFLQPRHAALRAGLDDAGDGVVGAVPAPVGEREEVISKAQYDALVLKGEQDQAFAEQRIKDLQKQAEKENDVLRSDLEGEKEKVEDFITMIETKDSQIEKLLTELRRLQMQNKEFMDSDAGKSYIREARLRRLAAPPRAPEAGSPTAADTQKS